MLYPTWLRIPTETRRRFAGGTLTTDAGLLLVREFDEQLRLSAEWSAGADTPIPGYITHEVTRSCASGCTRSPRATRTSTTRPPAPRSDLPGVAGDGRTPLGSQPTLSRLENAIEWPAIERLARTGVDWFCGHAYGPTSTRPISFSISTAPMIRPTGRSSWRCFMAGTTSTRTIRSSAPVPRNNRERRREFRFRIEPSQDLSD